MTVKFRQGRNYIWIEIIRNGLMDKVKVCEGKIWRSRNGEVGIP